LALFIYAEQHRLLLRIQIQAYDIGELLEKFGIPRQLESFDPMRFQIVILPDIVNGGLADALAGISRQLHWLMPLGLLQSVASTLIVLLYYLGIILLVPAE
jgi:hypothetical protein